MTNFRMSAKDLQAHKAARELISDPKNWITRDLARNAQGVSTYPESVGAVAWCGIGALKHVNSEINNWFLYRAGEELFDTPLFGSVINDLKGHAAVLQCYDFIISHAEVTESP